MQIEVTHIKREAQVPVEVFERLDWCPRHHREMDLTDDGNYFCPWCAEEYALEGRLIWMEGEG